mgnify:CR=1 FL=1
MNEGKSSIINIIVSIICDSRMLIFLQNIPQSMWFLSVALHNRPKYLLQLIQQDLEREKLGNIRRPGGNVNQKFKLEPCQTDEKYIIFKY